MIFLIPFGGASAHKKWTVYAMLLFSWTFLLLFTVGVVVILSRNINMEEGNPLKSALYLLLAMNIIGGVIHFLLTMAVVDRNATKRSQFLIGIYLIYQIIMFTIGIIFFVVLMVQYPEYIYGAGFGIIMMLLFLPTLIHFFFMHLRFLRQRDQPVRYMQREYPNAVYTNEEMPDYIRHPGQKSKNPMNEIKVY
ncbi:hypothetical protein QR680_007975 [Steinernema hermaphroditum]|uniref:Uncharacterized protein n=1 Tax=Steinernema hermaphroditum TaxID=289476 RepID=A0AA39M6T6_9BILA|nr:hypothetical protein QR680_007975 [Steinernema hermaphroditum]